MTEQVLEARQEGVILNYDGEYVAEAAFNHIFQVDNTLSLESRASSVTAYVIPMEYTTIIYYNKSNLLYYEKDFTSCAKR